MFQFLISFPLKHSYLTVIRCLTLFFNVFLHFFLLSSTHWVAGGRMMCHFIILDWLNCIKDILLLIRAAIDSTWDKTDYKSCEWNHRRASVSTLCAQLGSWVCEEEEKQHYRKENTHLHTLLTRLRLLVTSW